MKLIKNLLADAKGTAAVELGLVLGLITLAILGGLGGLGNGVQSSFNNTSQELQNANS